jgi:hypothetical protein
VTNSAEQILNSNNFTNLKQKSKKIVNKSGAQIGSNDEKSQNRNVPDLASRTSEDECKWYKHQMIYFPETIKQ